MTGALDVVIALLIGVMALSTASSSNSRTGIPEVNRPYRARVYANVDGEIQIGCPVTNAVFVDWYKDGVPVTESGDIRIKSSGEFDLIIREVKDEDAGVYSCKAVNGNGPHPWLNFTLHVLAAGEVLPPPESQPLIRPGEVAPSFIKNLLGPRALEVAPGAGPKLRCRAEGVPRPTIDWYKNGQPIPRSENAIVEGFSLKLNNMRPSDGGQYMCRVHNNLGSINFTYTVSVMDRQTEAEVVPPYPLNTSVNYGAPASLQCRVKSQSKPTIRWLKQVQEQEPGSTTVNGRHYILVKNETTVIETDSGTYLNTLAINAVTYDDAGMYVCLGINQRGGSDMREAFLKVVPGIVLTTPMAEEILDEESWDYMFGSPSATLAVIIAIPVVIILIVTVAVIYGLNKKKRKHTGKRRPPNTMVHEHEASVPLNINGNNAAYSSHYSRKVSLSAGGGEPYFPDQFYRSSPYRAHGPHQYSQYSQSDGSYRSALIYPPPLPEHSQYVADIPDTDSHFSSVSHTRPQFMPNQYERDIQSDPPLSRIGHPCPPPPPSSYYSEQW